MPKISSSKRGPRAIDVALATGSVTVYANARVATALRELTDDMTLYHGVRLAQVIEAAYDQGLRNGRREVFEEFDKLRQRPELRHRNPGRPTKKASRRQPAGRRGVR